MPYCIRPDYQARAAPQAYDDSPNTDRYQDGVYKFAAGLVCPHALVVDYGAGSGYKLAKYFAYGSCLAIDLNAKALMARPIAAPRWAAFTEFPLALSCDLLLCADMLEHLTDPDIAMRNMARATWDHAVISTPDRARLVASGYCQDGGPPRNPCHAREWTGEEFALYVAQWFPADRYDMEATHDPGNPTTLIVHLQRRPA